MRSFIKIFPDVDEIIVKPESCDDLPLHECASDIEKKTKIKTINKKQARSSLLALIRFRLYPCVDREYFAGVCVNRVTG